MRIGRYIIAMGYIAIAVSAALGMAFMQNHPEMAHMHQEQIATPWALFNQLLAGLLAATLSLTGLRDGQWRWTLILLTAVAITWLVVRVSVDPSCLGALHQHGCHTFLAGILIVLIGCVTCAVKRD